jgi:hypothetical protein
MEKLYATATVVTRVTVASSVLQATKETLCHLAVALQVKLQSAINSGLTECFSAVAVNANKALLEFVANNALLDLIT